MSSCVLVVVRMKVNSGGAGAWEGREVCVGVTSSLILFLFLRRSLRVIAILQMQGGAPWSVTKQANTAQGIRRI